jgi:hypothetical protein
LTSAIFLQQTHRGFSWNAWPQRLLGRWSLGLGIVLASSETVEIAAPARVY